MYAMPVVAAGEKSNMAGSWSSVWSKIQSAVPGLATLLTIAALALVAAAIVKYLMDRRRGGGGNNQVLIWTLLAAGVLSAPALLLPLGLKLADGAINFVGSLINVG